MYFFKTDSLEDLRDGQSETCKVNENCRAHEKETSLHDTKRNVPNRPISRDISKKRGSPWKNDTRVSFIVSSPSERCWISDTRFSYDERYLRSIEEETLDLFSSVSALLSHLLLRLEILRIFCWILCAYHASSFKDSHIISFLLLLHFFSISITISQFDFISSFWNNYNKILLIFLFSLMFIRYLRILKNLAIFLNFTFRLLNF